jgi:medium-chain acyl-[acyl-carrier-protein] hydrolase
MSDKPLASPWVKLPPRGRGRVCLFCFPYAGGGNAAYLPWMHEISPEIEICPVQLPGREERIREPPFTRMQPLVEAAARALEPYLQMPFAFFGHSLGAMIGFELTRYLRRQGWPLPLHLFASGFSAPQIPLARPSLHNLPDKEFRAALAHINGTSTSVLEDDDLMGLLAPLLRADFAVFETYAYLSEAPLDLPISVYGGLGDTRAPRQALEAWRAQTTKRYTLRMYDGDHFFLHAKRSMLLQGIQQDLRATLQPHSS